MRRKLLSIVVAVLALSLGACGTAAPAASAHPKAAAGYVKEMREALAPVAKSAGAAPPSAFEKSVLAFEKRVFADYYVSATEEREAEQLFTKCMADKGWNVQFLGDGSYSMGAAASNPDTSGDTSDADSDCDPESGLSLVWSLYYQMKDNPQDLTTDQQVRACYKKHKVLDGAGLPDADFSALVNDLNYRPSTAEAMMCLLDPDGSLGLTPQQAAQRWQPPQKRYEVRCDKHGQNCALTIETPEGSHAGILQPPQCDASGKSCKGKLIDPEGKDRQ